jgi:hypothetical protein
MWPAPSQVTVSRDAGPEASAVNPHRAAASYSELAATSTAWSDAFAVGEGDEAGAGRGHEG